MQCAASSIADAKPLESSLESLIGSVDFHKDSIAAFRVVGVQDRELFVFLDEIEKELSVSAFEMELCPQVGAPEDGEGHG